MLDLLRAGWEAMKLAIASMPLLLAVLLVLFVTSESWQFFGRIENERFVVVLSVFMLATLIVIWTGVRGLAATGTPTAPAIRRLTFDTLFVAAAVFVVFVAMGVAAIDDKLTQTWASRDGSERLERLGVEELWERKHDGGMELYDLGKVLGEQLFLSEPLLRVAALLAGFAALTFAVELFTDSRLTKQIVNPRLRLPPEG